jgi:nicotinic acid phosphoribosyltransferase
MVGGNGAMLAQVLTRGTDLNNLGIEMRWKFHTTLQVLRFLESFRVTDDDISYLKTVMPHCEGGFWDWMRNELDVRNLKVYLLAPTTFSAWK